VTGPVTADMTTTVVHSYKLLVSRALEIIKSSAPDCKSSAPDTKSSARYSRSSARDK